jgi:outer membrane protein insertion porin family
VKAITAFSSHRRLCAALLVGTMLSGIALPAHAQQQMVIPVAEAEPEGQVIRSLAVTGNQRLEQETVLSYTRLRVGEAYNRERLDEALRELFATELFADVQIRDDQGAITVEVRENPVINRIVLEGNRRLKDDKITPEIRLAPRQIFTRSRARADVARIIELYRRQGRFAAQVEPKIVELDQNRVDVVFEIDEGPVSRVRQINIIGNENYPDGRLRGEMSTKEAAFHRILSGGTTYDPDRMALDQQLIRQFYLSEGYADMRVVSAVAELTPDRRDFIITYVIEEGERYRFGNINVESQIRDLDEASLTSMIPIRSGQWFNARQVEDVVTLLNETAGTLGYAFAEVQPNYNRDRETLTMDMTFRIAEAPRVYVERIDIRGNTNTRDKVVRREFRLAEGDPFNSVRVRRSRDRIQSLGFFQENLEIEQLPGSAPDRMVLAVNLEEKATGELNVSAGFSSLERFLVSLAVTQRNFMGKGQVVSANVNWSNYSKSVELGFTEPYLFDRNIAVGADIYRRDYSSFNRINDKRNTTYQRVTTGGQIRSGIPITEYLALALRYSLNVDEVELNDLRYFSVNEQGEIACDPLQAGSYLCDALGKRTTSAIGYTLIRDTLNNRLRPSRGDRLSFSQDFAGLGGSVKYLRNRLSGAKYWSIGRGFVFSTSLEGGYIHSFEKRDDPFADPVRLIDRFFLGEPQFRGFDIRGVGPRVQRVPYEFDTDEDGNISNVRLSSDSRRIVDDALGGRAYYLGRAELELPLGSGARDLGLRPSIFMDVGALWGVKTPRVRDLPPGHPDLTRPILNSEGLRQCLPGSTGDVVTLPGDAAGCPDGYTLAVTALSPFREVFVGNTASPRLSIGFGVNWNSPFGPFRIDIAKALIKAEGDDAKLFTFNVGTAF